jgi:hypothetical protein
MTVNLNKLNLIKTWIMYSRLRETECCKMNGTAEPTQPDVASLTIVNWYVRSPRYAPISQIAPTRSKPKRTSFSQSQTPTRNAKPTHISPTHTPSREELGTIVLADPAGRLPVAHAARQGYITFAAVLRSNFPPLRGYMRDCGDDLLALTLPHNNHHQSHENRTERMRKLDQTIRYYTAVWPTGRCW